MEDRYGHRISYLRVSITDRCNERCTYCMPHELQEWLPREDILTYEETLRLIRIAADLGVTKIRVTGGEPLTRRDIVDFIREIPKVRGINESRNFHEWDVARAQSRPDKQWRRRCGLPACTRLTFHSILWIDIFTRKSPAAIFTPKFWRESMPPLPPDSIKSNSTPS